MKKLTGLIAAPYTPFHPDGSINLEAIGPMASLLARDGVAGAFVCGTTGEGSSLTITERKAIAEKWAMVCEDAGLALIVHVGHNSVEESKALAVHAQTIGAHSIAAFPPSYFKPTTIAGLVAVSASIAASAPALPFYYYHIPSMTGVNLSMPAYLKVGGKTIPTLAGIKYSNTNLMEFRQCATMENGRFTMFFGSDEMLLGALSMGAEGAVGSTYNYAAPNYLRMIDAYKRGNLDEAQRFANHAIGVVEVLFEYGVLQAGKAIMAMRGVDCGPVRLPLEPLSLDQKKSLYKQISALPIFGSVSLTPPSP